MNLPNPILIFDIETRPDIASGKRLNGLELSDNDAALALENLRRQDKGHDFPRIPFHEVICISGLWVEHHTKEESKNIKLFSFSQKDMTEKELLARFIGVFDKHFPILVSWNGSGFDLPVLMHRALLYSLSAPALLDQGELNTTRKYNNYQNRYQSRHTDLMDVLAMFNGKNFQKLDDVAQFLGFPGKQGLLGADMAMYAQDGRWDEICEYCESDVLNTWLTYLRWQLLRGHLDSQAHEDWLQLTRDFLSTHPIHKTGFLEQWQQSAIFPI